MTWQLKSSYQSRKIYDIPHEVVSYLYMIIYSQIFFFMQKLKIYDIRKVRRIKEVYLP